MTTPAMVTTVSGLDPNPQTVIVSWSQPCPVTVGLLGDLEGTGMLLEQ